MTMRRRYKFRVGRRALVLIFTSCNPDSNGHWRADPGHKSDELKLKAKYEALGFKVVEWVSLQGELPTEDTVRECIGRLADTDFGWCDGVFVVIAAHGKEGGFYAGPTAVTPGRASGPVPVRDIVQALQMPPQGQSWTKAAETLLGKPKIVIQDMCRVPETSGMTAVEHPLRAASFGQGPNTIYDHLEGPERETLQFTLPQNSTDFEEVSLGKRPDGKERWYKVKPHDLRGVEVTRRVYCWNMYEELTFEGERVTRYSDFALLSSTLPFHKAGVRHTSNFLSELIDKLCEKLPLEDVFKQANNDMMDKHANGGRVMGPGVFPQTAEMSVTLRKQLFLCEPMEYVLEMMDGLLAEMSAEDAERYKERVPERVRAFLAPLPVARDRSTSPMSTSRMSTSPMTSSTVTPESSATSSRSSSLTDFAKRSRDQELPEQEGCPVFRSLSQSLLVNPEAELLHDSDDSEATEACHFRSIPAAAAEDEDEELGYSSLSVPQAGSTESAAARFEGLLEELRILLA